MAAPILTADKSTISLTPGSSVTVEVIATDPDAGTSTLRIKGFDTQGNPATVDVTVQKSDPIGIWTASVLEGDGSSGIPDPDLVAGVVTQSGTGVTVVASWPNS